MEQFTVQLNNATCTVCIGAGVLGRAGALLRQHVPQVRRWALAADENASALYGEWVQGYASESYAADNRKLIAYMERLAEHYTEAQLAHLIDIFVACSRYEGMFWDMAWNEEM